MKVLTFGWELPPHNAGGLGIACMGLTRALSEVGVEVTFVLPKRMNAHAPGCKLVFADNRPGYEEVDENVRRINTAYLTAEEYERLALKYPELRNIHGTLYDESRRYAVLARRIAMEEEHDIIHAHDWFAYLAGIEAKAVSGKPLIVHVHLTAVEQAGLQAPDPNIFGIEKIAFAVADQIIAVSAYEKSVLEKYYGVPGHKIEVVHNAIDQDDSTLAKNTANLVHKLKENGTDIVMFAGRITVMKGPDYFLRAARKVIDYRPNTVFVVAGSGDMEQQIIQEAAAMGIGDKVLFAGFLRGDSMASLYNMADLFVMPSVSEPFGLVALEAAANGVPVIVSKQSGVSEVMSHAIKVDFWDTDEMANKMICILNNESLQESMKNGGVQEVAGVVWKKAAEKCKGVYNKVNSVFQPQV